MKVTQELVDRIIARSKKSGYGLSEPLLKRDVLQIENYQPQNLEALALLLVNAYHDKYDLVSIFLAAMVELTDKSINRSCLTDFIQAYESLKSGTDCAITDADVSNTFARAVEAVNSELRRTE